MIPQGATSYPNRAEADAAAREAAAMRKLGHAVMVYETYDHENKFLSAYATHYDTCRACSEIKQEAWKKDKDGKQMGEVKK